MARRLLFAFIAITLWTPPVLAVGIPESGMWFDFTPQSEIDAYYDEMTIMELCNSWKRHSSNTKRKGEKARVSIGGALERRGESPFLCQVMGFGN